MKALEIENSIKEWIAPGYILTGSDEYLKSYVKTKLLGTIPESDRTFCYTDIDLDSGKSVNDIIMSADTGFFMSFGDSSNTKKMVDVSPFSAKFSASEEKMLKAYFDSPSYTAFVLFEGSEKNVPFLSKICTTIDCSKATEDDLFAYIFKKLKANGYSMKPIDIRQFIRDCNLDFGKIINELDKLMLYCYDEKKITNEDEKLLTPPDLEIKIYELTNALNKGEYDKAISTLQTLKERGETANGLFAMLCNSYRRLLNIALTNADDYTISKTLGMSIGAVGVNRNIIGSNKNRDVAYTKKLKEAVEYMAELEYKFKVSIIDPDTALTLAVNKLIAQKG